jgi:endonuclease/exonuclease/phosphatase family metal-dependent hydrolase
VGSTYLVAWWNLENLFDEEDSPRRSDKLTRVLGSSINGWTPALRDRKISQLASVIAAMNSGAGPDLMGVCEIENAYVLRALADAASALVPSRTYEIVHADTIDERGIDVAFLYDPTLFTAPPDQRFQHVVMRRTATREIVQVNFTTHRGRTWAVFGNHWPSRSGGEHESAGYRAIAGETLAYFHQRVLEVHGPDTPVLAMGDFNDEPFDASLVRHALSTRQRAKVANGSSPRLWNLMWPLLGAGLGTFYFDNYANVLDQFLVNKNLIQSTGPLRAEPETAQLFDLPGLARAGAYPAPIPFGGMGKPVNPDGYSDHYPVTITITESD